MKALTRLAIIPALIILLGVACSFSAGDTSSSDTSGSSTDQTVSSPTEAAVDVPTEDTTSQDASSQDSSSPTSEPYTTFTFDTEPTDWSYWLQSGNENDVSFQVDNGKMHVEINGKETYLYFTYDAYTYDNVYIETVVDNRGVNSQSVSLLCRYSESEGWYEVNVQNDGLYNIFAYDARKKSYDMLTSGGSNAIKQGKEINAYGFDCTDRTLTLWINGTKVTEFKENKYQLREGNVGFAISSYEALPVIVDVDEVTIDKP
jgi:hypothetical protein